MTAIVHAETSGKLIYNVVTIIKGSEHRDNGKVEHCYIPSKHRYCLMTDGKQETVGFRNAYYNQIRVVVIKKHRLLKHE